MSNARKLSDKATHGSVVQVVYTETFTPQTITSAIPGDSTIPQSNEGTEVMSVSITPKKSTNYLLVDACITGCEQANVGDYIVAALFRDSGVNALAVGLVAGMGGGTASLTDGQCWVRLRVTAGSTAATTFKIRVGNNNGTAYFNSNHNGFTFGGKIVSTLTVTEIEA